MGGKGIYGREGCNFAVLRITRLSLEVSDSRILLAAEEGFFRIFETGISLGEILSNSIGGERFK